MCVYHEIDEIALGHLVGAITFSALGGVKVLILIQYPALMRREVEASEIEWGALRPCFDGLAVPFGVARRQNSCTLTNKSSISPLSTSLTRC
jgi:hypothetical protein